MGRNSVDIARSTAGRDNMDVDSSYLPLLESRRVKIGLAYDSYKTDTVRIVERNLHGMTHLLSSRQGLWAVNESECRLLAYGFFFGITFRNGNVFVFEGCDLPRGPTAMGRIVELVIEEGRIVEENILVKGLDNGCHQIDFIGGHLHVLDTYNQTVLRFGKDWQHEVLQPFHARPPAGWRGSDPDYVHVNSLLAVGDRILLLLHNGGVAMGRKSECVVVDKQWRELERWQLDGTGCHSLALLEDGTVLTCGSLEGTLISVDGTIHLEVSPYMTRGLSVGGDSLVVGASQLAEREGRLRNSGTVTFMDRAFNVSSVLEVPGAPMELRRLDGQDASLSSYLALQGWGETMRTGGGKP